MLTHFYVLSLLNCSRSEYLLVFRPVCSWKSGQILCFFWGGVGGGLDEQFVWALASFLVLTLLKAALSSSTDGPDCRESDWTEETSKNSSEPAICTHKTGPLPTRRHRRALNARTSLHLFLNLRSAERDAGHRVGPASAEQRACKTIPAIRNSGAARRPRSTFQQGFWPHGPLTTAVGRVRG